MTETLNQAQLDRARVVLQRHYAGILKGRPLRDEEVYDEIFSLRRKCARGTCDDGQERLVAQLSVGSHAIWFPD